MDLPEAPEYYNFAVDVVERWAALRPEAPALWWVDESLEKQRVYSFGEMASLARAASSLFAQLGIGRGDHVMIMSQRTSGWWIAMLGLIRLGAVPIPGTPLLTSQDVQARLRVADITALITDAEGAAKAGDFSGLRIALDDAVPGWVDFNAELARPRAMVEATRTRAADPGIIYFTSGTVGEAKMVLHTQVSYALAHRITGGHWLDLKPDDVIWALADTGWGKTAWSSFFGPWQMGACVFTVDMRSKFDPALVLRALERFPISVFCSPATALRLLVRRDMSTCKFPRLRHCVSAGEALNPPVLEAWRKGTGLTIHEGYGQTESVLMIGHFPSDAHPVRPGSMGRPAPGYELALLDEDGHVLKDNQEGQLAVRIHPRRPMGLFQEYWKNPAETAQRICGDYYLTGDMAVRDADGYYWFVGRADDVINSSSYRIGPSEVESALQQHPAVLESAAVGVADELRGQVVKAYIVLREGLAPSDTLKRDIQTHCKRVTAPYKYPRQIEFITHMPKTASGKIRRVELRAAHARTHGTNDL